MYTHLVGEIGIPRDQFLYSLRWWEIRCIAKGYERRSRHVWSAARWTAFNIMTAQVGSNSMREAGIIHPTDLLELPWEKVKPDDPDQSEINEMRALMRSVRRQLKESNGKQ